MLQSVTSAGSSTAQQTCQQQKKVDVMETKKINANAELHLRDIFLKYTSEICLMIGINNIGT